MARDVEAQARSARVALERAERLGAFVSVGRTIDLEGEAVEIIRTLADCIETAVFYRAPRMSRIGLYPLEPPEIVSSWGSVGGLEEIVVHFEPVLHGRREIVVGLGSSPGGSASGTRVVIPVDRARTRGIERHLDDRFPLRVENGALTLDVVDARVGVRSGTVDLVARIADPSVLVGELGWARTGPRHARGPGPEAFWREWRPQASQRQATMRRMPDGSWQTEVRAQLGRIGIRAVKTGAGGPPRPTEERPPELPEPVSVVSVPGRKSLFGSGHVKVPRRSPTSAYNISLAHHPPDDEATGIEATILACISSDSGAPTSSPSHLRSETTSSISPVRGLPLPKGESN